MLKQNFIIISLKKKINTNYFLFNLLLLYFICFASLSCKTEFCIHMIQESVNLLNFIYNFILFFSFLFLLKT